MAPAVEGHVAGLVSKGVLFLRGSGGRGADTLLGCLGCIPWWKLGWILEWGDGWVVLGKGEITVIGTKFDRCERGRHT